MSTIDDGGPAFPQPVVKDVHGNITTLSEFFPNVSGLSLRDWFAGQALGPVIRGRCGGTDEDVANECYRIADAMLKARNGMV